MFDDAVLRWKIWRLECARQNVLRKYDLLARKTCCEADEAGFVFEGQTKIAEIDDAVQQLQNDNLIRLARRYLLVLPPAGENHDCWEQSDFTSQWRLKPNAFVELRDSLRAERKTRREMWQSHIVVVSAATGLAGALTGLISIIFLHRAK